MPKWVKRGYGNTISEVIVNAAGVSEQELLHTELEDPRNIANLKGTADAFIDAVNSEQPIFIIGDYDSDGLNATAILTKLLQYLEAVNVKTIIPKRISEGYGLSQDIIDRITPHSFVMTIDNGITAVEEIKALKNKGCTVAVLDHHLPADELPPADFLVDPHIKPEDNGFEYYCGAGLGFQLARLILEDDSSEEVICLLMCMTVHAAIATITDMMPLLDANRAIVKEGIRIINEHRMELDAGLQALLDAAATDLFNEDTFGFKLGPLINAPARLYNAGGTSVLKELVCQDMSSAKEYVAKMVNINESRKAIVQEWFLRVCEQLDGYPIPCPLCVYTPGVPEGIVGIIAGKLTEQFNVPAFMFSESSENGVLKGSGRSGGYVDLTTLLDAVRPLTVKCGGHAGAAGISVERKNFEKMAAAMKDAYREVYGGAGCAEDVIQYDMELVPEMVNGAFHEMSRFAPFGQGVEKPVILIRGFQCVNKFGSHFRCMGAEKNHLKLNGTFCDAVGFGMVEKYLEMGSPATVDILCTLNENRYNGVSTIQLSLIDFRPTV